MTTETRVENWKAMLSNPKMRPEFRARIAAKLNYRGYKIEETMNGFVIRKQGEYIDQIQTKAGAVRRIDAIVMGF